MTNPQAGTNARAIATDDPARAIAHDLSNLLTAIIGAADAVLERGLDPETRADIAHIREGARRGTALVVRLRGDGPPHGVISINETIHATSRLLAHRLGPGVVLTLQLAEPDAQVRADEEVLDRVLLNLIANAGHAITTEGTVILSTGARTLTVPRSLVPDTIPSGDYVVIGVADTGAGMPRDQLPRIFEPGFTTRHRTGGTGLGLSSVRDLVRQSGGYLAVESIEGQGTRFEIFLPRLDGNAAATPLPAIRPDVVTTARTALLVEDDPLVSRVAERMLSRAGWNVLCADTAEDALEILKKSGCDLMISDVAMPGMDGLALTRLALALLPGLPVILTSGYENIAANDSFGIAKVEFLTKPYGQKDLLAVVARMTTEQNARQSPVA